MLHLHRSCHLWKRLVHTCLLVYHLLGPSGADSIRVEPRSGWVDEVLMSATQNVQLVALLAKPTYRQHLVPAVLPGQLVRHGKSGECISEGSYRRTC